MNIALIKYDLLKLYKTRTPLIIRKQTDQHKWKTTKIPSHLFISPPSLFALEVYLSPAADISWGRLIQRRRIKASLSIGAACGNKHKAGSRRHIKDTLTTQAGSSPERASGSQMDPSAGVITRIFLLLDVTVQWCWCNFQTWLGRISLLRALTVLCALVTF